MNGDARQGSSQNAGREQPEARQDTRWTLQTPVYATQAATHGNDAVIPLDEAVGTWISKGGADRWIISFEIYDQMCGAG